MRFLNCFNFPISFQFEILEKEIVMHLCAEKPTVKCAVEFFIEKNLVVTQNVTDTIRIDFLVNNKGSLSISNIQSKPLTRQQIPGLDSLITHSLQGLPKLYPAIKRSQLVQSAFQLPLILVVK